MVGVGMATLPGAGRWDVHVDVSMDNGIPTTTTEPLAIVRGRCIGSVCMSGMFVRLVLHKGMSHNHNEL